MRFPTQSQPVQRCISSQPFATPGRGGTADGERNIQASQLGILPVVDWPFMPKQPVFTTMPVLPRQVFY
jgi:hypothetical protein